MMSLLVAAARPTEPTIRFARKSPPPSKPPRPAKTAIIIHRSDLDDEESPDADDSAITFSTDEVFSLAISLADKGRDLVGRAAAVCCKCSCSLVQANVSWITFDHL